MNIFCRAAILVSTLSSQGYTSRKPQTTSRKLYVCHEDLVQYIHSYITLSGTLDFTTFGEFMISPIHFIIYMYILRNLSVLRLFLINDYGFFAWMILTSLSRIYYILYRPITCICRQLSDDTYYSGNTP